MVVNRNGVIALLLRTLGGGFGFGEILGWEKNAEFEGPHRALLIAAAGSPWEARSIVEVWPFQ
jgi:hypothetical protein